ncbi:Fused ATP-binding protein and permease of ABC transporter [Bifidobacterium actinocoloniiforme DSM 22766]|uniref:Fused ATP-binding protein and permease of ABC transporter n=1 Tax=Bifidobacterium actinocoloniiforme DSM 22766 TaxID=1437605 RepID=A0A086Z152_9BIFI|nr:energy-coupling factor transporter ATPase [Bifidobacterium actinocoloniiforme]KFI40252.1 Fused ATP-binding protein and permease of ABC transporter [Bifidobacterium actinocoloniiforme DSM 22766]
MTVINDARFLQGADPAGDEPAGDEPAGEDALARLKDVSFSYDGGASWALDGVTLDVRPGELLCILGANGSGKSTLGRILSGEAAPDLGQVELMGRQVFANGKGRERFLDADAYRQARKRIGMVFQNPQDQIVTTVAEDDAAFGPENLGMPRQDMLRTVPAALDQVGMEASARGDPTRMSGGQQQRLAVAGSLAMGPKMMVLDEPGAMLDADGRRDIQAIMRRLTASGTAVVHITHLLDQAEQADRLLVLDHGQLAAEGKPQDVLTRTDLSAINPGSTERARRDGLAGPAHDLLTESSASLAASASAQGTGQAAALAIELSDVSFRFPQASKDSLTRVNLRLQAGRALAVIGRNGSGKSTLARLICALAKPSRGSVRVAGLPLAGPDAPQGKRQQRRNLKKLRTRVGYVMQYPERQLFADTVAQDVAYGPGNMGLSEAEVNQRVDDALNLLGISNLADRSPFDLSGGQQRLVAIAGVVACTPQVLVLDEVTAGLDPQAASRIMNLLELLRQKGVTIVLNTHSEREAMNLADLALLLEEGQVVSFGATADVLENYHLLLENAPHSLQKKAGPTGEEGLGAQSQNSPADADGLVKVAEGTAAKASVGNAAGGGASTSPVPPLDSTNAGTRSASQTRPSLVARLDPRAKIVTFLLAMLTAFFISTPLQLLLGLCATAALFAAARAPMRSILRSVRAFLVLMVFLAVLNLLVTRSGHELGRWGPLVVTIGGIWVAVLYSCRFTLIVLLGALLVQTTTPTQMTDAFASLFKPLTRLGLHTDEIAMVLSLALRFIPTLDQEMRSIIESQAARGGSIESGGPSMRLHATMAITIPVFAGALRHADNLSRALDARCYEGGRGRTHYRLLSLGKTDMAFIALMLAYVLALIALGLF